MTQVLPRGDVEAVRERTDELLETAKRTGLRRLTPYALAVVAASRALPASAAEPILRQACRLDPQAPEPRLAVARLQWSDGHRLAGLAGGVAALALAATDPRLATLIWPSATLSLLAGILVALTFWATLVVGRAIPRLWHDLGELAGRFRLGANGPIAAALVVALPVFLGGDPFWLALWLVVLTWPYLGTGAKVVGALGFIVVAATPTLVESSFRRLTHPADPVTRGALVLADRRHDPQGIEELLALRDFFGEDPEFHRLVGDLYRQAGLLEGANRSYREGLHLAPRHPKMLLALGAVQYLEGDYNAALQSFNAAKEAGADPIVTGFDLSLTLAQTYHYRESDEILEATRRIDPARLRQLTRGREHDLIAPAFSVEDARAMLARKDPIVLLNRSLLPPPLLPGRTVFHPATIGGLMALALAIAHLLARRHTTGFAAACLRCGRTFCPRCRLSSESHSYCSQCVNIFLKKDMVAIEAQMAKRRQLARRASWLRVRRRVADLVLPGLGLGVAGRPVIGTVLAAVATVSATTAVLWVPSFLLPALMGWGFTAVAVAPGLVWLAMIALAQMIRVEEA